MRTCFLLVLAGMALFCGCAPYLGGVPSGEPTVTPTAQPGIVEVSAAVVQANNALFQEGTRDLPASVVFSLDPAVTNFKLRSLGPELFRLKNTTPDDPEKRAIAQRLTAEVGLYYTFTKVPVSMAGSDQVYIGDVWIRRDLLPKRRLGTGSDYGLFLMKCKVDMADNRPARLEHVGIVWITRR